MSISNSQTTVRGLLSAPFQRNIQYPYLNPNPSPLVVSILCPQLKSSSHLLTGSALIVASIKENLNAWVIGQPNKEAALKAKGLILESQEGSFDLNLSGLEITSLPPCLTKLNLKSLNCSWCPLLTALPVLPFCTLLSCYNCPLLTELPPLSICTDLDCSYCPLLTVLPDMPLCTLLNCSNCLMLKKLPSLDFCTKLSCSNCRLLTVFPKLPICIELSCSACRSLTKLPPLPFCTMLDTRYCPLLTELPPLSICTDLDCSYCPLLTALPDMPLCIELSCSYCPLLRKLPSIPFCIEIRHFGCPLLLKENLDLDLDDPLPTIIEDPSAESALLAAGPFDENYLINIFASNPLR